MTRSDLKKQMGLPPIQQPPNKNPRSHRRRDRVRLEIPQDQCDVIMELLTDRLQTLTITDPQFKATYALYSGLQAQREKVVAG